MISEIQFPQSTLLLGKESGRFYRDAFVFKTTEKGMDSKRVYHGIFGYLPKSIQVLLKIRNAVVRWLGFKATDTEMSLPLDQIQAGKPAGFLTIDVVTEMEIVCTASEKNMDLWISVIKLAEDEFAISTLVNLKTGAGRVYMTVIKPFHKMVAKYAVRQALKDGRI